MLQNKSKKSGPLKALSSVFASEEKVSDSGLADPVSRKFSSPPSPPSKAPSAALSSAKKNAPNYASKDDLSMTRDEERKKKSKVKTNPYATIKMWRPITMTSSVSHNEDVYRSFTNFDALVAEAKLPATGDLRNDDYHASATTALGRTVSDPGTANEFTANATNGDGGVPAVADGPVHRTGRQAEARNGRAEVEVEKKRASSRRQAPPAPTRNAGSNASVKRTASQSTPSSAVTYPLKSRSLSLEEQREQEATLVPPPRRSRQSSRSAPAAPPPPPPTSSNMNGGTDIPTDYPNDSSSAGGSLRSRSLSQDSRDSSEGRRGRSLMESSCAVVGADVSKSVKSVLSRTYGPDGFEAAAQDVETMLARLKVTMESLKVAQARVSSGGGQFQTVRQELQLQTKQFVQDAKHLVASATGSREAASQHLHLAMHTLARLLLHSQATMVRMRTVHQAQHVGFEVLKVSASFKSTVAAANAAMGRPTTDPHMKYLMRQATNLAGLLSTLLKTLKTLEQA